MEHLVYTILIRSYRASALPSFLITFSRYDAISRGFIVRSDTRLFAVVSLGIDDIGLPRDLNSYLKVQSCLVAAAFDIATSKRLTGIRSTAGWRDR